MNRKHKKYNTLWVIVVCILVVLLGYMMYERVFLSSKDREITQNIRPESVQSQKKQSHLSGTTNTTKIQKENPKVKKKTLVTLQSQYPQNDSSIFKYVSPTIAFDEVGYTPKGLVKIEPSRAVSFSKTMQIREDILPFFQEMSESFFTEFKNPLHIVSAYRGYEYQARIEKNNPKCVAMLFCARAGHSEHQTGLTFDFFETTDEETFMAKPTYATYYYWLKDNAHKYGFTQSYQKGKETDGYNIEPWHWRYVGKELAGELHKKNITFSEWYRQYFEDRVYTSEK